MIFAAFALLGIGTADVLRQFLRGAARGIGMALAAIALLVAGVLGDAVLPALAGIVLAAAWIWLLPAERRPRLSFWPAVLLTAFSLAAVALLPARAEAGVFGAGWRPSALVGEVSFDLTILALGVFAVMLETGNVVVRAALLGEQAPGLPQASAPDDRPGPQPGHEAPGRGRGRAHGPAAGGAAGEGAVPDGTADDRPATAAVDGPAGGSVAAGPAEEPVSASVDGPAPADEAATATEPAAPFRGGRLIGPLERVLVLVLTLAGAYALLAAMLAAKGIVRFPEISRDGAGGTRAEYFLVGSLVSWVVALGGAFLLQWAA